METHGVQADLRIPFPCRLVFKGSFHLPEGQTLVGMFAYRRAGNAGGKRAWREWGRMGTLLWP